MENSSYFIVHNSLEPSKDQKRATKSKKHRECVESSSSSMNKRARVIESQISDVEASFLISV